MEKKLTFNSNDIINEKIPKQLQGYSVEHVNKFLDVVAHDYEKFEEVENTLLKSIEVLKEKLDYMDKELRKTQNSKENLRTELDTIKEGGDTDYATVLNRINKTENKVSNMEKVFSEKLDKILQHLPQDK